MVVANLFNSTNMFKILESNTIITQMKTFQRKLHNRGGPTKDEYHIMRPENAIAARARGSPKIRRGACQYAQI